MLDVQVGDDSAIGELLNDQGGTVCVNVLTDFEERDEMLDVHVVVNVTNGANGTINSEDATFSDLGKGQKPLGVLPKK